MLKPNHIKIFFYIFVLFIIDIIPINNVKANINNTNKKNLHRKNNTGLSEKLISYEKSNFSVDLNSSIQSSLIEDLAYFKNSFIDFLASNDSNSFNRFNVEVESDIQYEENNRIYIKGNAIVYFSKATLKADLIVYDKLAKTISAKGNVIFKKGEQYLEASNFFYDLKADAGNFRDVYGLIDTSSLDNDLDIQFNENQKIKSSFEKEKGLKDLKFINKATIGLSSDFEDEKSLNVNDFNINIPNITRWRFKSDIISFKEKTLNSKNIYFTNDPFNEPQFLLRSKNFSAEIVNDKLKIISRNTWINFDNKISLPIGRRKILDEDPLIGWGIGSDFSEKDGYYIFRGTNSFNTFGDFELNFKPYFLIQRAFKGKTNSFRPKNESIFSSKLDQNINLLDYFALDINSEGILNSWDVSLNTQLNSLNPDRLNQSLRSKITFTKKIDLTDKTEKKDLFLFEDSKFENSLDFQFYSSFREKVYKGFDQEAEIYFGSGLNVSNIKSRSKNNKSNRLGLIYDVGEYTAKQKDKNELSTLFRNAFIAQYDFKFPLWEDESKKKNLNETFKYIPKPINQNLSWETSLKSGLFLYSDGSNQSAITLTTGPSLTLGNFKNQFLDYTKMDLSASFKLKNGVSPFNFDDIDQKSKLNLSLNQQILGPLIFSYANELNLENGSLSKPNYALDIQRRAYSIGAFYNATSESLGIRFNIYNFNYSGVNNKF